MTTEKNYQDNIEDIVENDQTETTILTEDEILNFDNLGDDIDAIEDAEALDNFENLENLADRSEEDISQEILAIAKARIAELEVETEEAKDTMLRAVAESDNVRRRAEKEKHDTAKFAVSGFAKNLLSVADNLRRALGAVPEDLRTGNDQIESLLTGIEATERELLRAFDGAKITPIAALNEMFNPNLHEVMFEIDDASVAPGTILQILENGYTIHERLLRPARVGIAKGGQKPQSINEEV